MIDPHNVKPQVDNGLLEVIRQSNLGTADICHRRLQYERDPATPRRLGEALVVGTAYHAGQEAYWKARRDGRGITRHEVMAAAASAFNTEVQDQRDLDREIKWVTGEGEARVLVASMLDAYFDQGCQWPDDYEVLAVEETIYAPFVDGWAVKGTLDLVLRDSNGWEIIVDHKTAGRPWKRDKHTARHNNQASWYDHWWRQVRGHDRVTFAFDVITHKGVFERRLAAREQHERDAVLRKAEDLCRLIDTGLPLPPNTDSFLCSAKWCSYWSICPWGEALESGVTAGVPVSVGVPAREDDK